MIAKLASGNRVTPSKSARTFFEVAGRLEIPRDDGRFAPMPMRLAGSDAVGSKPAESGITEDDAGRRSRKGVRNYV